MGLTCSQEWAIPSQSGRYRPTFCVSITKMFKVSPLLTDEKRNISFKVFWRANIGFPIGGALIVAPGRSGRPGNHKRFETEQPIGAVCCFSDDLGRTKLDTGEISRPHCIS
jgi:hypothetical protein